MRIAAGSEAAGERLDRFLAGLLEGTSRSQVLAWIRGGRVRVDSVVELRGGRRLRGGESLDVEPTERPPLRAEPEAIEIDVLYEDEHLVVVDKAAGMVVHPGAGRASGTLVNALLHRLGRLPGAPGDQRPGIVHRLDRFTTGVMVVAKTGRAHRILQRQFQKRAVDKLYWAAVEGRVARAAHQDARLLRHGRAAMRGGTWWVRLEMPIRRDKRNRVKMAVARAGREAVTEFRLLRAGPRHSMLEARIHTGRTHQIRVHLARVGHPVVGDALYGARRAAGVPTDPGRYLLHARSLAFDHPATGDRLRFRAPLPPDFAASLGALGL